MPPRVAGNDAALELFFRDVRLERGTSGLGVAAAVAVVEEEAVAEEAEGVEEAPAAVFIAFDRDTTGTDGIAANGLANSGLEGAAAALGLELATRGLLDLAERGVEGLETLDVESGS